MAEFEIVQFQPDMEEVLGSELNSLVKALSADPTAFVPALQNMLHNKVIEYRDKARVEASKELDKKKEEIESELPSKESLIDKLRSFACSPSAQKAMERAYNNFKDTLNKGRKIAGPIKDKMNKLIEDGEEIKALIRRIGENLKELATVVAIIAAIIIILKALILVCKGAAAIPILSPIIPIIIEVEKIVLFVSEKIVDPLASVLIWAIPKALVIMGNMIVAAALAILGLIAIIDGLLALIDMLEKALEALYTKYLNTCNVIPPGTDNDGNISDDINNFLDQSDEDLNQYLDDTLASLNAQGNTEVIEKIYNANFTQLEYKRYRI